MSPRMVKHGDHHDPAKGPCLASPERVGLLDALDSAILSAHYARKHGSVPLGHDIATCTDEPCRTLRAHLAALADPAAGEPPRETEGLRCACTETREPVSMSACPTCFHLPHGRHAVCDIPLVLARPTPALAGEGLARALSAGVVDPEHPDIVYRVAFVRQSGSEGRMWMPEADDPIWRQWAGALASAPTAGEPDPDETRVES